MNKDKEFIKDCFNSLILRKIIRRDEIKKSTISDSDIKKLQDEFDITCPTIYIDFLQTYYFNFDTLLAVVDKIAYFKEQYVMIIPNVYNDNLKRLKEFWRVMEKEYSLLSNGYIPIGDWGDGWGPLCIDTNKDITKLVYEKVETWTLVWFDSEEFFEKKSFEDISKYALPAAPDFKEFLDWYFRGKYLDKLD